MKKIVALWHNILVMDIQARIYMNNLLSKQEKDTLFVDCTLDDIKYNNEKGGY